jgi:hypothetical protein
MLSSEPSPGGFNSIRVLVPGTGTRFRCGGLSVALQTARLLANIRSTEIVTYQQRQEDHPFLDDLLQAEGPNTDHSLWLVSWGFHVPRLLHRLKGRSVIYQAHSTGYGFDLPPGVPVLAVSRNTLGYWGDRAPRNPLFLIPNALEPQWLERGDRHQSGVKRPIDVLVQQRKSSDYVLTHLVPALRARGLQVEVQSGWVEDLIGLFNRATVYLYDSAEHWRAAGVSEGFGLPPLEAMACGCVVFSSFNHALADSLTPGESAHQIGQGLMNHDVNRIISAVAKPDVWKLSSSRLEDLLQAHSEFVLLQKWRITLESLDQFFSQPEAFSEVCLLRSAPIWRLRLGRLIKGLTRVVNRFFG